ncbi:MAG: undecaprenyl-diphosphate phosphatase [Clostridia bacterium]|nr:undecaprenyl-diphosphate phosphatase [Clostridia bacterium]
MISFLEILKSILYGVVEGITEWLPISSTGHLILLEKLLPMNVSDAFWELFLVVIQLGAILAVVVLFWNRICPFSFKKGTEIVRGSCLSMWYKVIIACIPGALYAFLLDDLTEPYLYNPITVAVMLILVGIVFLYVEKRMCDHLPHITDIDAITYRAAVMIGLFQLIAAVFPGTSRSGATILGALLLGLSRTVAAEFTFVLAIPVMFGSSLLKVLKFGLSFTQTELVLLAVGVFVSFIISLFSIRFLMDYVKRHTFKGFAVYRILLGVLVLLLFPML